MLVEGAVVQFAAARGLLTGAPSAGSAITAIAWCVAITLIGYLWARATFTKRA